MKNPLADMKRSEGRDGAIACGLIAVLAGVGAYAAGVPVAVVVSVAMLPVALCLVCTAVALWGVKDEEEETRKMTRAEGRQGARWCAGVIAVAAILLYARGFPAEVIGMAIALPVVFLVTCLWVAIRGTEADARYAARPDMKEPGNARKGSRRREEEGQRG